MGGDPCRRIKRLSTGFSLGVHAAILIWVIHVSIIPATPNTSPDPIAVELVAVSPDASLSAKSEPAALEQIPPVRSSVLPPAEVKPVPKPAARVSVPRKAELQKNEVPGQPAIAQAAALPAPSNAAQDSGGPIPEVSAPPNANDDTLRLYAEAVRTSILTHKPAGIRSRGIVGLAFSIARDGQLATAEVSASSGSEELDRAALSALRHAGPFPPFPAATSQQYLMFSISFQFQ
jgi:protein TonB